MTMEPDLVSIVEEGLGFREGVRLLELKRDFPTEICLFVFLPGARKPSLVIKGSVEAARAAALRKEHANLELLHRLDAPALARTIPRPVFTHESGDRFFFAQTCLEGERLKNRIAGSRFTAPSLEETLDAMLAWFAVFHEATETLPAGPGGERPGALLTGTLDAFRERFEPSGALVELLDECGHVLAEAGRSPRALPRVFLHGDLSTANVLVREGALSVIDWERPLERHLPLVDFLHFIASCRVVDGKGKRRDRIYRENLECLFFAPGTIRDVCRRAVNRYMESLGLAPGLLRPLYTFAWAAMAVEKYRYLESIRDESSDSGAGEANRVFPVTFFSGGSVLNLELLARHGGRILS